jgi:RNA polymerase-binding transcription factor DksA
VVARGVGPGTVTDVTPLDVDAVLADLDAVEVALERLDAGTYWTDEVTGEPLSAELLEQRPTARRNG